MNFCRLCLNTVSNGDSKEIGNYEIGIMSSLLIDMNLNTTKKYIICDNCLTNLNVLHKFKSMCLSNENYVPPLIKTEPLTDQPDQTDLTKVCKKEKDSDDLFEKTDNQKKCRLCLKFNIEIGSILSDSDENEDSVLYMISRCIPEVDMGATKKQIVCKSCYGYLKNYISFMNKCIETEHKVDYFCHINGIDKTDGLDLSDVVQFKSKDEILLAPKTETINSSVKQKISSKEICDNIRVKPERIDVKMEQEYDGNSDFHNNDMEIPQVGLYHSIFFPEPSTQMYNNDLEAVNNFEAANAFATINTADGKHVQCYTCGFQTLRKPSLRRHFWRPEKKEDDVTYKCNLCFFMTKYKNCLLYHKKIHSATEGKYKCDMCNLETPNRRYLNRHMLTHKDYSETIIYRCDQCPYMTKQKFFLRSHVNKHSAPKFQCQFCPYKAKYSSCFRRHMSRWHKDDSEKQKYICYFCGYDTFDRETIVRHLQTHRDRPNVHKCEYCEFQTQLKEVFRRHLENHINPDRKPEDLEQPFQCDMCEYKTKFESKLAGHKLIHKPEQSIFRCDMCSYVSEKKSCLRRHKNIHKDRVKMECYVCQYQTVNKNSLVNHMMIHRDASKVQMYKCNDCGYESRHKANLASHIRRHVDMSVKKEHKCEFCGYKTYLLKYLKRHMWSQHKVKYKQEKTMEMDIAHMAMPVFSDGGV